MRVRAVITADFGGMDVSSDQRTEEFRQFVATELDAQTRALRRTASAVETIRTLLVVLVVLGGILTLGWIALTVLA